MQNNDRSRTQQVVEVIISAINTGTIQPGERLPSQRDMAELFGVSRTVIREAIKLLEGRNVVQSKKGSGIYVAVSPFRGRISSLMTSGMEVRSSEILEYAKLVWQDGLRLMVRQASEEEIASLAEITRSFYHKFSARTSLQQRYIYETTFGLTITQYSHLPFLHLLMSKLLAVTSAIDYKVVANHAIYRSILEIDIKIVEAIAERNAERAVFLGQERDRVIDQIIAGDRDLLEAVYKVDLHLEPVARDIGNKLLSVRNWNNGWQEG